MNQPWHLGRMAALDFESSDKDPLTARIVSCALILVGGGLPTETFEWLVNPGIPMEPGAIAVHGITDEYAAAHGQPAREGVEQIAAAVSKVVQEGVPLVGHNLGGYDLTLMDAECTRHGLISLEDACGQPLTRVIDTMTVDRHVAPFRRKVSPTQGPYTMKTTAQMYGLGWDDDQAHGAAYDALKSVQAAWVMGAYAHRPAAERPEWVQALRNGRGPYEHFDDLAVDLDELFVRQQRWHHEWAANYQAYLRESDATAVVDTRWPLRSAVAP